MPVFGVTGGIATGKSSFVRLILKQRPAHLFDADSVVHRLLARDAELHRELRAAFGAGIFDPDGQPSRDKLRQIAFDDPDSRRRLEELVHPRVALESRRQIELARAHGSWLYADIPLLYETNAAADFDEVIVVACSPETQNTRLRQERGLAPGLIARMIGAQLDLGEKMARADHVIWNDSTPAMLEEQARLLLALHLQRYGRTDHTNDC
ncbi:MAG: dephospho-CoA kinase [Chthoniobacteraceae bacterium]